MNPYFRAIRDYGKLEDRTSRFEFWIFYLILIALIIAFRFLDDALGTVRSDGEPLLTNIFALINVIPLVTIYIRRLHDSDRTGWWLLLPPAALIFAFLPSLPGPNRYGPAPAGTASTTAVLPPEPAPDVAAAQRNDPVAEIERLARLKATGALTEAEFATLKARALGSGEGA